MFLNVERIEFPDIDSDISKLDRAKGIEYLLQKYGAEYVCQIITFTKYKLKNLIKDSMRAFSLPYEEANAITKALPDMIDGKEASYEYMAEIYAEPDKYVDLGNKVISQVTKAMDMLKDLFNKYPDVYEAVNNLTGCISSFGLHAGGVIIAGVPLAKNIPLTSGSDTAILPVCQIAMEDLDFYKALNLGAVKLGYMLETPNSSYAPTGICVSCSRNS